MGPVLGNGGVGEAKDLGDAAIVGLDLVDVGLGVALVEFQHVLHVGTPPGVNRLGVVANDHQVSLMSNEEIDHPALELVGVLILVDEYEFELIAEALLKIGVFIEELDRQRQEIVKVHAVGLQLLVGIEFLKADDVLGDFLEPWIPDLDRFREIALGVLGDGKDVAEDFRFGKAVASGVDATAGHDGVEHGFLILAIHDGEPLSESEALRVAAENAIADGVERAAPEAIHFDGHEFVDALQHFARGLVREGE